jgi:hypothetical protein
MNVASITATATSQGLEALGLEVAGLDAIAPDAPAEVVPAACVVIASSPEKRFQNCASKLSLQN